MTKPIPDEFTSISPHIVCRGAADAINFYKKAFGAEEKVRFPSPDGKKIMHAALRIGDTMLLIVDEMPEWNCISPQTLNGTPVTMHLYVKDADAVIKQAESAGAEVTMPAHDAFWGDRYGVITDPFGHSWEIATHVKDMTQEEMAEASKEMFQETK